MANFQAKAGKSFGTVCLEGTARPDLGETDAHNIAAFLKARTN